VLQKKRGTALDGDVVDAVAKPLPPMGSHLEPRIPQRPRRGIHGGDRNHLIIGSMDADC
jgi:hypothetical protein